MNQADHNRNWRHRNPEKARAHARVNWAKRTGKLAEEPCEKCGTATNVHAHHDDYSRPLEVRWLCHECHEKEHHGEVGKRKSKPPRLSKRVELKGAITELRASGMSYKEIGKRLGISMSQAFKSMNDTDYK